MKKILKVSYPPITTNMVHAPVLSIISDTEEYLPWFLLNYIQIRAFEEGIDFYYFYNTEYCCPYLEVIPLNRDFISRYINIDITEFISECIENNYYIVSIVDTYFISLYANYKKDHFVHPIFIYGYDKNDNSFLVADFFKGRYSFEKTCFTQIREAYQNCDESNYWLKGIKLIRRKEWMHYFEIDDFKNVLAQYLLGHEPSIIYNHYTLSPRLYGLNKVYEEVYKQAMRFSNFEKFDQRVVPIFCDHKKVLYMAIKFLLNYGQHQLEHLLAGYNELFDQSIIYRNKLIKCMVAKQNNAFDYNQLNTIKSKEIYLLGNTLELLNK